MTAVHFINLTNGIQAIEDYQLNEFRFIRLQSTACEQKRFEDIIMTISDDFLISAALGNHCVVYDYGANKDVPRAIWQGIEWIKYALNRRWHKTEYTPQGRAAKSKNYFDEQYTMLSNRAKARMDYFGRYIVGPLQISSVTKATNRDGNYKWYAEIIKRFKL